MKVISLLQPWATLVVMGAKKIETIGWPTDYHGTLLIHASAGKYLGSGKDKISCRELCYREPFKTFINGAAYDRLPFGAIIGQADVAWAAGTTDLLESGEFEVNGHIWLLTELEQAFGDYSAGRYGWLLKNAVRFNNPVKTKGSLGLWNHNGLHEETIICPECKHLQIATVEHTIPFATYIHHCTKCKYIIMESEWNKVEQ